MGCRVARASGDHTKSRMQPRPSGRNVVHHQSIAALTQRLWVPRGRRPRLPPGRQKRSFLLHFHSMRSSSVQSTTRLGGGEGVTTEGCFGQDRHPRSCNREFPVRERHC